MTVDNEIASNAKIEVEFRASRSMFDYSPKPFTGGVTFNDLPGETPIGKGFLMPQHLQTLPL